MAAQFYEQALELRSNAARQHMTVACIRSAHDRLMPRLLAHLKAAHPNLCLTIEDHHNLEILLLENRRVDVGITHAASANRNLASRLLYEEPYRVVFRAKDRAATGRKVHPGKLRAEHGVFQTFDPAFEEWFNRWWPPYSVKVRVNTTPTATSYFSDPRDWIIVPEAVAKSMEERGFVSRALAEPPPPHRVYMVLNPRSRREGIAWFAAAAEEMIQQRDLL